MWSCGMRTRCSDIAAAHRSFCPSVLAVPVTPWMGEKRFSILLYSQIKHAENGTASGGREDDKRLIKIDRWCCSCIFRASVLDLSSKWVWTQLVIFQSFAFFKRIVHIFLTYASQLMREPYSNSFNPHDHPSLTCQSVARPHPTAMSFIMRRLLSKMTFQSGLNLGLGTKCYLLFISNLIWSVLYAQYLNARATNMILTLWLF